MDEQTFGSSPSNSASSTQVPYNFSENCSQPNQCNSAERIATYCYHNDCARQQLVFRGNATCQHKGSDGHHQLQRCYHQWMDRRNGSGAWFGNDLRLPARYLLPPFLSPTPIAWLVDGVTSIAGLSQQGTRDNWHAHYQHNPSGQHDRMGTREELAKYLIWQCHANNQSQGPRHSLDNTLKARSTPKVQRFRRTSVVDLHHRSMIVM